MDFAETPQGGGGWFKPADYKDATAFLIEVKGFDAQRPGEYGPKDSVLTDITIFTDEKQIETDSPEEVKKGCRIEYTVLTADLSGLVGKATIVKLGKSNPKKPGQKPAWVWRPVDAYIKKAVMEYGNRREAAIKAALESVPDFD